MLLSLILAGLPSLFHADPKADQFGRDLTIITAAKADGPAADVGKCAVARVRDYSPSQGEMGSDVKGGAFLAESLQICGENAARHRVETILRTAHPDTTETDLKRQVDAAFVLPTMLLLGQVIETFDLKFPSKSGAAPPIVVPCPAEKSQPSRC